MALRTLQLSIVWLGMLILICTAARAAPPSSECVVLLHGLARSDDAMKKLARYFTKEGYTVVNQGYPSRKATVQKLAAEAIPEAISDCANPTTIHFVTHSMGGILVRQYLSQHSIPKLGRTVMLGPPNKGSQVVDKMSGWPGYSLLNGPAGKQLGTQNNCLPCELGEANFELGVIAGNRSINLILSQLLPGQDDGKVTVENTKLEGMADHIVLPVTHTFMMHNRGVIEQASYFLKNGRFNRP